MDIRKRISGFFTITCTSFTVIMLLYAALWSKDGIRPQTVFGLFGVCAGVGIIVFLTGFIPFQSVAMEMGVYFIEEFITVFLFGGVVLKLFPFDLKVLLIVIGMLVVAYLVVVAAIMVNEKICSDEINKKLAEMKKRK